MPVYEKTPVISTSEYADGDIFGTFTLPGALGREVILRSLTVYDNDGEDSALDFFFFEGALSGTYTPNAAFSIDAGDTAKFKSVVSVAADVYVAAGTPSVASLTALSLPFNANISDDTLSVVIVTRTVATYTAATDVRCILGFENA